VGAQPHRLIISRRFEKDLRRLDRQTQQRILRALESLEEDAYRGEKVVAQETGNWKLRVGDWRIRYDIVGSQVHLLRVRHRREVYRED
jgi:addiction module RelE/StbE family toxin